MREILFRGKRIDNEEWVEGNLVTPKGEPYIMDRSIGDAVDPETVGQYTGLVDGNGKKIFEGDIVEGTFNHEKVRGYIFYGSDAAYFIRRKGLYGIGLNNAGDWVSVIGNIHDNPEMILMED